MIRYLILFFIASSVVVHAQSISGTVAEQGSGEAVVGANVLMIGTQRGAATNAFGFFSIPDINPGVVRLRISAVGYKTDTVRVDLTKTPNPRLEIELVSVSIEMEQVLVEADREPLEIRTISQSEISMEQINRLPSLGGEPDIFKALLFLPGVQSSNELSAGLNVRGGTSDQNLVLLDKMVMYNPYHLGGFMSTFNSDAINHVKLIKGALPAEYGGRLSSAIDVTMKEGSKDGFHGSGGISMIDSRLTLEGPLSDNATYMISGRRVYLDVMTSLLYDDVLPYYFYDLLAKTNVKLDENNRVYLSGFFGRDVLEPYEDDESGEVVWGNTAFNTRWTHVFSNTVFSNVSLVYTEYSFNMQSEVSQYVSPYSEAYTEVFKSVSSIDDLTIRGELEYFYSKSHSLKTGMDVSLCWYTSEATDDIREFISQYEKIPKIRSTLSSIYLQDEWKVTDKLVANIGGRLFYFDKGDYLRAEPRIAALYTLDDGTVLKAGVMGANQFLHLVSRTDLSLPIDMWFPSTNELKPSFGWQYTVGATKPLCNNAFVLTTEAYYKTMNNILEFEDDAEFSFLIPLESELTSGKGNAYGLEILLQRSIGSLTGWLAYTYSKAEYQFLLLNKGKPYPPTHDRSHDISLVLNYRLGEKWEFTAAWTYSSGQPITFPVAQYSLYDYMWNTSDYLYTEKNGFRKPAYHRMDLNFSYAFEWFDWDWKLSMNVYNAYMNMNAFSYYVEREYDSDTRSSKNVIKKATILPFIPTFGLSFRF